MKLKKILAITMAASCLSFAPQIYISNFIPAVRAEIKMYTGTGEGQMSEIETEKVVQLRAREKAIQSATEKAGVALLNYSRMLNNVLADDEIFAITSTKYELVGEPKYERIIQQITDLTMAVIWRATVNVNVDDSEVQNWLKLDEKERADFIAQTNENQRLLAGNDKKVDDLREQYLNAKSDAEKERIKAELEKVDKEFLEILAVKKFRQGKFLTGQDDDAAEIAYTEAIELVPDYALVYLYRGKLNRYKNYTAAIADFTKVIEIQPENFEAYYERGNVYIHIEEEDSDYQYYQLAIADFSKAIELKANYAEAYNRRGDVYYILKEPEKALEDYNKAIQFKPNDSFDSSKYYSNRGGAYFKLKDYKNAVKDLTKAVNLEPTEADHYIGRAEIYTAMGEYQKAVEDYTMALKIRPYNKLCYKYRAEVYEKMGETAKAKADMAEYKAPEKHTYTIDELNKIIQSNPNDADAYLNRGNLYRKSDNFDTAISDYNKAVELNLKNADAYNKRGLTYYKMENYDDAMKDFNQAIKINPKFADAYCNRGLVWHKLKEFEKAVKDYTKAIEIDPANKKFYKCRANSYLRLNQMDKYGEDLAKT